MDQQFQQEEPKAPEALDQYVPEERDDEQVYDQGNRVKYKKLVAEQWLSLETKSFSQFELRVLDTLQQLGNQQAERVLAKPFIAPKQISEPKKQTKKKGGTAESEPTNREEQQTIQEVQVTEICLGQELYINVIRPRLVELKIVNKIQVEEDEESSEQKAKDQKKVKAKKPGAGQKKGGAPVVKKEDLMRIQLSKDKVADQTMKMFQMMGVVQQMNVDIKLFEVEFLRVEQASKRIKSLKWLELKFSALLVYADQLIKCHLETKLREEYTFELIYFLKNVFIKYQDYKGQSYFDATAIEQVAPEVMRDVRRKLIELNKHFKFSNRVLFNRYPRLVIDTDLNQSFLQTDVKPYKAQVSLIEKLGKAVTPQLIFLNTMVGTGKTVLSVAVTQFLQRMRVELEGKSEEYIEQMYNDPNMIMTSDLSQMQILYCCPLDNVRTQVGAAAYVRKLPFGVASMWKDPTTTNEDKQAETKNLGFFECPRIVNSWSCRKQAFPTLIISDFKSTLELLKEKQTMSSKEKTVVRWQGKKREILKENPSKNGDQYILFIDEPTVDADFPDAETTKILVEIMLHAPPITILSSATLPPAERLPKLIKLFKTRYRDAEISTIQSEQFQIGCQIFSHLGHKFLPHYKVTTKAQLDIVLKRLTQNPFMQRCYNANAYCELNDRMKKCGLANIEDFEEFDLITQEIVQQKSIDLLKRLLNEEESIIAKVCTEAEPEELDDEGDGTMEINFNEEEPKSNPINDEDKIKFAAPYKTLKIRELAGKMAHKFNGGCLITVSDPVKLVREKFGWLLKDVRKASDYISQYEKSLELLEKLKAKKEKELDNEDERSKQVQALQESMNISIEFPDKLKVNTLEHYKRFVAGSKAHLLNRYRARKAFSIEAINFNLDVPDDILLFLFAGIATYTEKGTNKLDADYYKEVQNLASNGQLAFIVSDDSMCYGVNYPLNHVVIYDEMAEKRSLGALFQLIGRAGRVGVSWVANAYLEQKSFDRLISYLEGNELSEDDERDEAVNMERLASQLIEKKRAEAQEKRAQRLKQQQEQAQQEQQQQEEVQQEQQEKQEQQNE